MTKPKPTIKAKVEQPKAVQQEAKPMPEKFKVLILIGIIALLFIPVYKYIYDSKIENLGDNGAYYILGKSIAEGKGYVNQEILEKPQATHYPPGYPFFLSIVMKTFGESVEATKIANGFLLFSSLIFLFFVFKKLTKNNNLSLVITILLLFHYHLLQYSTWTMSEIPFLFISTFAILSFLNIDKEKHFFIDPWFFVAVIASAGAYYVRGQGLAVIAGFAMSFLFQKKMAKIHSIIRAFLPAHITLAN